MSEYNNPAGRLLKALRVLSHGREGLECFISFERVRKKLLDRGGDTSTHAVLDLVKGLDEEYTLMLSWIDDLPNTSPKPALYHDVARRCKKSLESFKLDLAEQNLALHVQSDTLGPLEFLAADCIEDEKPEEGEMDRFRESVFGLQKSIEASETLTREPKRWLLDLLRIMRDSLDRYASRGARGFREQIRVVIGELALSRGMVTQVHEEEPTAFQAVFDAIDKMNKLSSYARNMAAAANFASEGHSFVDLLPFKVPGS